MENTQEPQQPKTAESLKKWITESMERGQELSKKQLLHLLLEADAVMESQAREIAKLRADIKELKKPRLWLPGRK